MQEIQIINRETQTLEKEEIVGEKCLAFLYQQKHWYCHFVRWLITRFSLFSRLYGLWHKSRFSQKKILPFIEKYNIDIAEFANPVAEFTSFNDFFIRALQKEKRPICWDKSVVIVPADGRCLVFPDIDAVDGFYVKEKKFSLTTLLQDEKLSLQYQQGSMAIIRLAPVDYHRFHFPFDCFAHPAYLINGYLFSVNPVAVKQNIHIFSENKRMITEMDAETFGKVLFIEVGATNVGSIYQNYEVGQIFQKGEEKGYFSLGGSSIIMLFQKGKIVFDKDLIDASEKKIETKVKWGTSLGRSASSL